ncbi:MAG: hypothetical protein MZV63_63170 [Marinilabiliales bacterium]|nr:hypothetical protein [Marinilabiliales bacterium]
MEKMLARRRAGRAALLRADPHRPPARGPGRRAPGHGVHLPQRQGHLAGAWRGTGEAEDLDLHAPRLLDHPARLPALRRGPVRHPDPRSRGSCEDETEARALLQARVHGRRQPPVDSLAPGPCRRSRNTSTITSPETCVYIVVL